jgi:hypothetical protein
VEDGVPFCPHCGAPQIKVSGPAAVEERAATTFPPDTPGEVQPPAEPVPLQPRRPGAIDWSRGLRAAALAGFLLAICVLFVPVLVAGIGLALRLGQNVIGLLVMLASWVCMTACGALAVLFYRRRRPDAPISAGIGARVGAVSGLLGFVFYGLPQAIRLAFFHLGGSIRDAMRKAMEQAAAQNPDPRAQEIIRNLLSPGVLAAFVTFLVVAFFLVFLIFSSLGGAIGASIWGSQAKRS